MRKRMIALALLAAGATLAGGCASRRAVAASPAACCAPGTALEEKPDAAPWPDRSIYQLESRWTNDLGESLELGSLTGRPQIVVMFFASCTAACPILVHDLQRIRAALSSAAREQTGFNLITIDGERDTPEALHQFRRSRGLPGKQWTLLRGGADDTLELAILLGVKFKREGNGQFAHSNLITVLSAEGEVICQLAGLRQDIEAAVKAIEGAASAARR